MTKMLLELTAGLVVILIALTPDLRDWGGILYWALWPPS